MVGNFIIVSGMFVCVKIKEVQICLTFNSIIYCLIVQFNPASSVSSPKTLAELLICLNTYTWLALKVLHTYRLTVGTVHLLLLVR